MYRFLNTYETGCKKLKLNDEDMIAMFMFYLNADLKKEFMELQIYKPSATWEEFRSNWAEKYHEQTYQYCWKYLSSTYSQGLLSEFARKKSEVIRKFCKTISDSDLIQIISWSFPIEIQKMIMPKLITTLSNYFKELEKFDSQQSYCGETGDVEESEKDEGEGVTEKDLENMEIIEEDDDEDEAEDEEEEDANGPDGDDCDESDPGLSLFE